MRKFLTLFLALAVLTSLFTGCGLLLELLEDDEEPESQELQLETFGDIYKHDVVEHGYSVFQNLLIVGFSIGDDLYRAGANITDETEQKLWDLGGDPDKDEEFHEIIDGIRIGKLENINDLKLTQEEMDALVGKTMTDLDEDGWYCEGYDLSTMEFWMSYGPFIYTVTFNGEIPESQYEDFSVYVDLADKTIKSVEYDMIGNASEVDMDTYVID